ncbi:hypothetical protein Lesp02_32790 [Lentzea sp. NBRC 105346]|uniref:hypothetical protein n=1 Tax=Lentzea sp. NBRC 105346 TaxID=3032205 RepID=UPI0024A27C1C|nr:hypothetical protein [Lentzea sp. NBRC 105346]GLZ31091.1 hypothetical protein Lesp02_32790 [Lentzea sp. NBRC 105346]
MFADEVRAKAELSDHDLSTWYNDFRKTAANAQTEAGFHNQAHSGLEVTLEELRKKLQSYREDFSTQDQGSGWHNVWHWIHG